MFETKESLEKGMREATKNLEESKGLANLHIEIVFKWEVLQSATQACLEQEIPFKFSITSLLMEFMPFSRPSLVCGLFSKSSQL